MEKILDVRHKGQLNENITQLKEQLEEKKLSRKGVPCHVALSELPEQERFTRLSSTSKQLVDTIKMIAYRAETAMMHILREHMHPKHRDEARALLRTIYRNEADLVPNEVQKTLTVRLHHLANHTSDAAVQHLMAELNATETMFPDTDLRLVYEFLP